MRSICFYFQVHQPLRLQTYRFFDIGYNHYYYNDFDNKTIIKRVAEASYLPMNNLLLKLIKEYGSKFKVSFSITGIAIDQFEKFAPEVIKSFQELAKTGSVDFIGETYAHSLASLKDKEEFKYQVKKHSDKIQELFGQKPKAFRNTALIYSDEIGEMVHELGYDIMLTEGAKHILGWKSPNYMYCNATNPKLKLLLKNYHLSDDISFRFSNQNWNEWPLTSEKFTQWLKDIDKNEEVVNLFMDYCTFGEYQKKETGIFEFMKALPKRVFANTKFNFNTPSELAKKMQPISPIYVPYPISWADEERDLTAWLGNELQKEAFDKLYALSGKVKAAKDQFLNNDWQNLQVSDHFYFMSTKWFSDGEIHRFHNPYKSPYEAFINYMNIISDFEARLDKLLGTKTITAPKKVLPKKDDKVEAVDVKKKEITSKENVKRKSTYKLKPVTFTKITELPNSVVKKTLKEMEIQTIAAAMKGSKKQVKEKVYHNIGKRASKRIEEILSDSKSITRDQTSNSRRKIEKELKENI